MTPTLCQKLYHTITSYHDPWIQGSSQVTFWVTMFRLCFYALRYFPFSQIHSHVHIHVDMHTHTRACTGVCTLVVRFIPWLPRSGKQHINHQTKRKYPLAPRLTLVWIRRQGYLITRAWVKLTSATFTPFRERPPDVIFLFISMLFQGPPESWLRSPRAQF